MDLVYLLARRYVPLGVVVEVWSVLSVLRLRGPRLLIFLSDLVLVWEEHLFVDNFDRIPVIGRVL